MAVGCVGTRGEGMVISKGSVILWLMMEELDGGIVAGSAMGFPESSGKTTHIVSHSHSILVMSFCRLAWKVIG